MKRLIMQATCFLLLLGASKAEAFIGMPYLTPPDPTSASPIFVNIDHSACEGILEGLPGFPKQTQDGSFITVTYFGVRGQSPDLCTISPGTGIYSIGEFVPGIYTLTVKMTYFNAGGGFDTDTLGVVTFVVGKVQAFSESVPALGMSGLLLLMVLVGRAGAMLSGQKRS
jgi:hypothetical protein